MSPRKKIAKNLYNRLKSSQADDVPLPAPTILEIKFYLKNYRSCKHVKVERDIYSEIAIDDSHLNIPQFVLSQLQAQKIADKPRPFVQISAILVFLSTFFQPNPVKNIAAPTLFLWHGPDKQKTYYIFAYTSRLMESRTYSVDELLKLKDNEAPQKLVNQLKQSTEIVKGKGSLSVSQSRCLKKPREDASSSAESEEIIFQGKKNQTQQAQESIADDQDTQWKYRGRSNSQLTSTEPLSAPTGLAAQQSEGFKRFFKAVVSPTHVRVTAGGRIVPNTRGSMSPTAKWDKERIGAEDQDTAQNAKEVKPDFTTGTGSYVPFAQPMAPPAYPSHSTLYPQMGMPMPFYPVPPGFAMPYGAMPSHGPHMTMSHLPSSHASQKVEIAVREENHGELGEKRAAATQASIKISPPGQFDQNRPYLHNGQVVYPHPRPGPPPLAPLMPNPYFPHGMFGNPAFAAQHMSAMAQASRSASILGQSGLLPTASANTPSANGGIPGPPQIMQPSAGSKSGTAPPITSIRPSEITKRQLDSMKSSLKYYEDQMQYNKHQVDEKSMLEQIHKLKINIEQFEYNYTMQNAFETLYYPTVRRTTDDKSGSMVAEPVSYATPSRPGSIKENRRDESSQYGSSGSTHRTSSLQQMHPPERMGLRAYERNPKAVGINSNKGNNSTVALDVLASQYLRKWQLESNDAAKKANLPSGAALAPTFHPGPTPSHDQDARVVFSVTDNPGQHRSSGVLPRSQRGSGDTVQSNSAHRPGGLLPTETPPTNMQFGQSGFTGPYLIGKLPQGVNPYTARATDYAYSRELTDEEKRARHVYWGQVPSKGLGLPKFDGKDFYPPSPVKTTPDTSVQPAAINEKVTAGLRPSENDPFRSHREVEAVRPQEGSRKFSKAIPIVAPSDAGKGDASKISRADKKAETLDQSKKDAKLTTVDRRVSEKTGSKLGHDLWQTMLKKGSAGGHAIPSTVSSTTATGYLPPYVGHAAASLGPAISNTNSSAARDSSKTDNKLIEIDCAPQSTEKVGENRPPGNATSTEYDVTKDLHERMLRDAERRGVISPDWQ